MKKIIVIFLLLSCKFSFSQKVHVSQDSIKQVCPDIPRDKRPRLTVPRFNMTAPNAPRDQFGDNLATMLTNALEQVNCYTVLSSIKDSADMLDAQNYQQNHGSKTHRVKTNNLTNPNVIVVGEVIKYEVSSKNFGIGVVHTTRSTATIGINVMLKSPETGEIIESRQFNAEKKVQGGANIGLNIPLLGRIDAISSAMSNPAVQAAVEDAINQAVVFISNERDKIPMPGNSTGPTANESNIIVQNINYEQVSNLSSAIGKIQGVTAVNSDEFSNNQVTLVIDHSLTMKDLLGKILQLNAGFKLSVQSVSQDDATLTVK